MTRTAILAFGFLAASLLAQSDPKAAPRPAPAADSARIEALVKDLGSDDFETRTRATEELRGHGEAARTALEKARTSPNLEQKTRAEALLEELGAAKRGEIRTESLRPEDELDRLRSRFRVLGPRDAQRMPRPEDFKDLNEWMEAMSKALGGGLVAPPEWRFPGAIGPGMPLGGHEFRLELGPGTTASSTRVVRDGDEQIEVREGGKPGIVVKITRIDPKTGEAAGPAESYEAPDLESLRQQFPEVHDRLKAKGVLDGGAVVTMPGFRVLPGPPGLVPEPLRRVPIEEPVSAAPVLGVSIGEVPEALRAHVELPAEAVMILGVEAASAAERAGLRAHDILTTVNGTPVSSAEEVRSLVQEASRGSGELRIVGVRKGQPFEAVANVPTSR